MMTADSDGVRVVGSFGELVGTAFGAGVNALCWERQLEGDFGAVVAALGELGEREGIVSVDEAVLRGLRLDMAGRVARDVLLADLELLWEHELEPSLDCVYEGRRDTRGGPVETDVYSYHADSATVAADSYLCSYTVAASEGLRHAEAVRRVDVAATRAALLAQYGGADDGGFREYLAEHCYDLHYVPLPGARPFSFGLGNLWRIAIQYPGCPVPPCIHRAPTTRPEQAPRLLLIS